MKRILERPGLVFLLVFAWKLVLLLSTSQPIPANDGFFYDGPVVHLLNHGGYFNPSISQSRPISGTEFFSAYPPLYQLALLAWMRWGGTTVLSAMVFHLALFGAYQVTVLAIFRRLRIAAQHASIGGLFLLAITFDDRPDGLACLLGTLGVYAVVRMLEGARGWAWLAAGFSVLAMTASLQMGALYTAWVFLGMVAGWKYLRIPLPVLPLTTLVLLPPLLMAVVRFGFPRLWEGFLENVHGNASLTGLRAPQLGDLLKAARVLAAVFLLAATTLVTLKRYWQNLKWSPREIIFLSGLPISVSFIFACLTVVAANWVGVVNYFQPILVALFLTAVAARRPEFLRTRTFAVTVAALVGLASIRAIGLTTWGVACATDVSRAAALQRVGDELDTAPANSNVLLSTAYLYEADRHSGGNWIHEDYAPTCEAKETFPQALRRLHAAKLVLTQFDYFRRYRAVVDQLKAAGGVQITITNLARVRAPDSYAAWQQVLQHVAWAPVIVNLEWSPPSP